MTIYRRLNCVNRHITSVESSMDDFNFAKIFFFNGYFWDHRINHSIDSCRSLGYLIFNFFFPYLTNIM